jgi:anaerobic magnesium-protoporphyrin IX monomethyl ester cyclase
MRICLVRLPSSFLLEDKCFPPLGLMAVATGLKLRGHSVVIYDGRIDGLPMDCDGYGFGPTTPEYASALAFKEKLRAKRSSARVVLGGAFAALNRPRVMKDYWDCVLVGDGEIEAERAFVGRESLIVAQERPLDEYPITDRSVMDLSQYHYSLDGRRATTLVTSRGCPWRCTFCCKTAENNSVRMRSAEHVAKEIDYLFHEHGFTAMALPDDIAILDRDRIEKIAVHFAELGIIWRCLVRADLVVKFGADFAQMMFDTGCYEVGMGVESASDKILKLANKGETAATLRRAVLLLHAAGIRVKGYFILGLPGETAETIKETESFLDDMKLDDVDIKIYQPYPGSPIWDNKAKFDIDWHDTHLEDQFYKGRIGDYRGNVRTAALTNAEIVQAMNYLEGKYKNAC